MDLTGSVAVAAAERTASCLLPDRKMPDQVEVEPGCEQATREPAAGRCRATSCLEAAAGLRSQKTAKFASFLFLVRWVQPSIKVFRTEFAWEEECCHALSAPRDLPLYLTQASRSYPRLPVTVRQTNSPTGASFDKITRASTSGASLSLRATCG